MWVNQSCRPTPRKHIVSLGLVSYANRPDELLDLVASGVECPPVEQETPEYAIELVVD